MDSLWYRKAEARALLPETLRAGAKIEWPSALVGRLVRHNLVDNVRGQTNGYSARQVQVARVQTRVVKVEQGIAHVVFVGESQTSTTGVWPANGKPADDGRGRVAFARRCTAKPPTTSGRAAS